MPELNRCLDMSLVCKQLLQLQEGVNSTALNAEQKDVSGTRQPQTWKVHNGRLTELSDTCSSGRLRAAHSQERSIDDPTM